MYCDPWPRYIQVQKLFKGRHYSRVNTIQGQKLFSEIRYSTKLMGLIFFTKKSKAVYLQGFWPKSVYLKCFWNQLKTVYLQGPHSSRPCCTNTMIKSVQKPNTKIEVFQVSVQITPIPIRAKPEFLVFQVQVSTQHFFFQIFKKNFQIFKKFKKKISFYYSIFFFFQFLKNVFNFFFKVIISFK